MVLVSEYSGVYCRKCWRKSFILHYRSLLSLRGWMKSHKKRNLMEVFFYGVIEKAFHNCCRKWDSWAVFNVSEVYKDMIFRCVNISVQSHFLFPTQHFWLAILPCLLRDFIPPLSSCPGEFGNRDVNFFFFNLTFSIQNEWEISAQGALGA